MLSREINLSTYRFQVRPHLELTFENILSHINTVYVLRTKKGVMRVDASEEYSYLRLKVSTVFDIRQLKVTPKGWLLSVIFPLNYVFSYMLYV